MFVSVCTRLCIRVYASVSVCEKCMYVHMLSHTRLTQCLFVCICVSVLLCVCAWSSVLLCTRMFCVCKKKSMYECVYMRMYVLFRPFCTPPEDMEYCTHILIIFSPLLDDTCLMINKPPL